MHAAYGPFKWEKHVHEEQVVVLTEDGAGEVRTRRGREVGGSGTLWVFSPGEYHFGLVEEGRRWQYRALYLDADSLHAAAAHLGLPETSTLVLRPGLHDDPQIANMLLRAHALAEAGGMPDEEAWTEALYEAFRRYGDPRPGTFEKSLDVAGMRLARDYIAEHFRDDIRIDELAALANVSRYHFMRAFRNAYGMPPHAYLNQVRLQHARRALLGGATALQAALDSGFYDQSRLTNLFKRCYGVTPGQYAHLSTSG